MEQSEALKLWNQGSVHWNNWLDNQPPTLQFINITIKDYNFQDFTFSSFNLNINLTIKNCTFENDFPFENVTKVGKLTFTDCETLPNLRFNCSEFGSMLIQKCKSATSIEIYGSKVSGTIYIEDLNIKGKLAIQNCDCKKENERLPRFQGYNIRVKGDTCFDDLNIDLDFHLSHSEFHDTFLARRSTFGSSMFTNCKFLGYTDFTDTIFIRPPRFDGAKLHQHTVFPKEENFHITKQKNYIDEDIAAFGTLKSIASNSLNRRQQGMFFALEQKYLRTYNKLNGFDRFISKVYEIISNYGRSLGRPLLWLFGFFFFFFFIYAILQSPILDMSLTIDNKILISAAKLSWTNTVIPLKSISYDSIPLMIISTIQSVLSLVLIALFLLALRWEFKRD